MAWHSIAKIQRVNSEQPIFLPYDTMLHVSPEKTVFGVTARPMHAARLNELQRRRTRSAALRRLKGNILIVRNSESACAMSQKSKNNSMNVESARASALNDR